MLTLAALPHDRLHLRRDELGLQLGDLSELPWVVANVASARATRIGIELSIGPFVGQLVIPGHLTINVAEPFPGSLATCLALTQGGRRGGAQESPTGALAIR